MTLVIKLETIAHWNKADQLECFERYHTLLEQKHKLASNAITRGVTLEAYQRYDLQRFIRYTKMWHYYRTLLVHGIPDMRDVHHRAQENKLQRYSHHGNGDRFP